jgi:uncharacterized protein YqjF (DUF2071 family)
LHDSSPLFFSSCLNAQNSIRGRREKVYSEDADVQIPLQTSMSRILDEIAHRPWPLPAGRWIMKQKWHDLLFAHWPVPAEWLRRQIPAQLEIDTFDGQAWLAVVPFRMSGVRLRGTPPMSWLSKFPELNVRTYVSCGAKPGVWFFSLDAGNSIAVGIARAWFHLPYFRARMHCLERDGWIEYASRRTHASAAAAKLQGRYRPVDVPFHPSQGTLEHFLTERYCLYALDGQGRLFRGEIHHLPWPLQCAEAEWQCNTMAEQLGIKLDSQPLLHFARRQDVLVWPPRRLA